MSRRSCAPSFPQLVSYPRFVALIPRVLLPLAIYLQTQLGSCTGISFIDSTALAVCHNARIAQHRVFAVDARRGKTSVGWFYGFKLHLMINNRGELLAFCLTSGNVDDRRTVLGLARRLFGKLFGDRGYIAQALAIEHSRHRSSYNFLAHLLAGLTAYCHQPKKPSLDLTRDFDLPAVG